MNDQPLNNKDFQFKGQYANEVVIDFFRPHWVTLMPHLFIHILILAVLGVVAANFYELVFSFLRTDTGRFVFIGSVLVGTYAIHNFFIKFISHFLKVVIITNLRIVEVQNILFVNDLQSSLDVNMIQDVEKIQKGIIKNLLKFGELTIILSSSDTRTLRFVPNPNYHFRLINRLKLESKQFGVKEPARQHQSILFENLTLDRQHQSTPAK